MRILQGSDDQSLTHLTQGQVQIKIQTIAGLTGQEQTGMHVCEEST